MVQPCSCHPTLDLEYLEYLLEGSDGGNLEYLIEGNGGGNLESIFEGNDGGA